MINRLSIRARISVGTLLLAFLFFGGVTVVVRHQVEVILRDALLEVLMSDAAPFETAIQQEPSDTIDRPGDGQLVAVIDPSGETKLSSLPADVSEHLYSIDPTSGEPQEITANGRRYLILAVRVTAAAGEWTVIAARDQDASELVLADLTTGLIVSLGALTLLFGLVSWLLTGVALRPVITLRRSADAIVAAGSDELLPTGPANDEIKDLAVTLNQLINDLRAAAARERQMVSDASHELRTPLAVLQAQLELLRAGDRSSLDADLMGVERATARLTRIVESLLELSRLEAGRQPEDATVRALLTEAGEAVDRARLRASAADVDISLTVPPHSGEDHAVAVAMPPLLYGRVLDNLLANAVRAVGANGRVAVTITRDASEFITMIEDNGPGMSASFLPHALDRFSQEDGARGASSGSGLGLAIVAAAAASAGGRVTLKNSGHSGLVVTLVLPADRLSP